MTAMSSGRVAIIGDVGGHRGELYHELVRLGLDVGTLRLPPDLTVVQVGDLVHRGPESAAVIALVDHVMTAQPDQWVQLEGNHEELYLAPEPRFAWDEQLPPESVATLRRWRAEGLIAIAAGIADPDGEWLVTHAGLTEPLWRSLGSPHSAKATAGLLNGVDAGADAWQVRRAGEMLGHGVSPMAGPIWASAAREVVPSWLEAGPMPFHQVHGHSTLIDWWRRAPRVGERILAVSAFDFERRHEMTAIGEHDIVGVDPSHGTRGARSWSSLVLTDAWVTQR
jgi:hypothetical protein